MKEVKAEDVQVFDSDDEEDEKESASESDSTYLRPPLTCR